MTSRSDSVGPLVHLRTLAPFRTLSPSQIGLLTAEASEVGLDEGGWLIPPGEAPTGIYMLLDGYLRIRDGHEDRVLEPWSLVGYPDVLDPDHRSPGVRAETDIVALRLETDDLRNLCERHFAILAALLSNMASEVTTRPPARVAALAGAGDVGPLPHDGALDRIGRMIALQRSPVLPRESMDAIAELAGRVETVLLEPGDTLWTEGALAEQFYVVCSGAVMLDGWRADELRAGVGSAPGFAETLSGRPYTGSVRAAEATALLRVGIDPFMDVAEDHFELGYAVLGRMAAWLAGPAKPGARSAGNG